MQGGIDFCLYHYILSACNIWTWKICRSDICLSLIHNRHVHLFITQLYILDSACCYFDLLSLVTSISTSISSDIVFICPGMVTEDFESSTMHCNLNGYFSLSISIECRVSTMHDSAVHNLNRRQCQIKFTAT